jgi:TATA-box binding protein (TBP) (component of TFIID and TFIIIB)
MTVVKELKKGGIIIISKPELKIQNIVASASLRNDRLGKGRVYTWKDDV